MEECKVCEARKKVHSIQMEGRASAVTGWAREDNPYPAGVEHDYWEYGWIEESFVSEIEEHRAVMDWTGSHLYMMVDKLKKHLDNGTISQDVFDEILNSVDTACAKLAEKLRGE